MFAQFIFTAAPNTLCIYRDNLIVQFLLPNELLQLVGHDGIRNGQLINVVPVMFSQGVHDIQVLSQ